MRYLHTTLYVRQLEEAISFFETWAGLTLQSRFSAGGRELAFLSNGPGETAIELIHAPGEEVFSATGLSIGFASGDLDGALARAQAAGLALSPILQPAPQTRFFFLSGPDGLTVQLVENCGSPLDRTGLNR